MFASSELHGLITARKYKEVRQSATRCEKYWTYRHQRKEISRLTKLHGHQSAPSLKWANYIAEWEGTPVPVLLTQTRCCWVLALALMGRKVGKCWLRVNKQFTTRVWSGKHIRANWQSPSSSSDEEDAEPLRYSGLCITRYWREQRDLEQDISSYAIKGTEQISSNLS